MDTLTERAAVIRQPSFHPLLMSYSDFFRAVLISYLIMAIWALIFCEILL